MFGSDFAKFSMKSLAVFDETIQSAHAGSLASFYRDFDGAGKETMHFRAAAMWKKGEKACFAA